MASSFAGFVISPLADGVGRTLAAVVNERPIPSGNVTYVDVSGLTLRHLRLTLLFEDGGAALDFESLVGTQGELIVFDGTYDAILLTLERQSRGVTVQGPTELHVEFLILSSSTEDDLILVEE